MRVLVFDDQGVRHDQVRERLAGHDFTHAYLWSEFVAALGTGRFDLVLLDHDLGDLIDQEVKPAPAGGVAVPYDGSDAAHALVDLPDERKPLHVIVMSWNDDGAKRMDDILRRGGIQTVTERFGSIAFWRACRASLSS